MIFRNLQIIYHRTKRPDKIKVQYLRVKSHKHLK